MDDGDGDGSSERRWCRGNTALLDKVSHCYAGTVDVLVDSAV